MSSRSCNANPEYIVQTHELEFGCLRVHGESNDALYLIYNPEGGGRREGVIGPSASGNNVLSSKMKPSAACKSRAHPGQGHRVIQDLKLYSITLACRFLPSGDRKRCRCSPYGVLTVGKMDAASLPVSLKFGLVSLISGRPRSAVCAATLASVVYSECTYQQEIFDSSGQPIENEDGTEHSDDDERAAHSGFGGRSGVVLRNLKAEIYIGKASPSRRVGNFHRAEKTQKSLDSQEAGKQGMERREPRGKIFPQPDDVCK